MLITLTTHCCVDSHALKKTSALSSSARVYEAGRTLPYSAKFETLGLGKRRRFRLAVVVLPSLF